MLRAVLLLLALAIGVVTASDAVQVITLANLEEKLDGGKPWLMEFYAPWCAHCQKLQPVWEEVAENHQSRVHFGKVDCTVEKVVCSRFSVEGYPRILFFPGGIDSFKEYRGARTAEGLNAYAKRITSPRTIELSTPDKVRVFLKTNTVVFMLCEVKGTGEGLRTTFLEAADQMYDVATFAIVTDPEVLKSQQITKSTILVVRENEQTIYTGPMNKDSLIEWVKRKRYTIMPELDGFNFKEVSRINNLTAIGLVDPQAHITTPFLQMLRTVAKRFEDRMSVGYINGIEWKKFVAEYDIPLSSLPRVLIVDSEMEYYLAVPASARTADDISRMLELVIKGEAKLNYGWMTLGKRIWNDWWLVLIVLAISVVVIPIVLLCCTDDGSERLSLSPNSPITPARGKDD